MNPNCNNCKHAGKPFKVSSLTHVHCENNELYPLESDPHPYDTLREWWDKCNSHEFKQPKEEVKE